MKSSFLKRKKQNCPYGFVKAPFRESTRQISNPGCGWYQIFPFRVEEEPDLQEASYSLKAEDSLVLALFDIGAYRKQPLDKKAFAHMGQILSFFSEAGKEVILRVVYDTEGKGLEHEPGMFAQVLSHIGQMQPLLSEFSQTIYVFQGFLVGSWGEMHTSKFLAPKHLRQLWAALKKAVGDGTFVAVRRPVYYRILYPGVEKNTGLGIFDDGMFGSETHLGTYGTQSKNEVGWEKSWNPAEEQEFEEELGRYAPCGGEAVFDGQAKSPQDFGRMVETLGRMRVSYLNRNHDSRLLEIWRQAVWKGKDAWKGMGGLDYIGRHLGYRFRIADAEGSLISDEEDGWSLLLHITIANDGFAYCYEEGALLLEGESGWSQRVALDFRQIAPGGSAVAETVIALRQEKIYASLCRNKDGRRLELANEPSPKEPDWSPERIFLGRVS